MNLYNFISVKYIVFFTIYFQYAQILKSQTINPEILWATYFGSPGDDFTGYVLTDKEDNIYMSSQVKTGAPTTEGVHKTSYSGGASDAMLTKFDKNGNLIWSTYFGGSGEEVCYYPISLMTDGAIVLTGTTSSTGNIATTGANDVTYGGGGSDIFLAVFETNGTLRWATYVGGSGVDGEPATITDKEDNIYLVGFTLSTTGIATTDVFQGSKNGGEDGFLSKFDKDGNLIWSTYYGGAGDDALYAIGVDTSNNIYVSGVVNSAQLATEGSFKPIYGGNGDGILAKFNQNGERLWATYFGAGGVDEIYYLNIDSNNDIYIIGPTTSISGIATDEAYSVANSGKQDVFVGKFNAEGQRLWSTFIGGQEWDTAFGCDFDKENNVYISVMTKSTDFPLTEDVPGFFYSGGLWDAAFIKFSPAGELKWSTYFGGNGNDRALGITLDKEQNIIASINSDSEGLATPGAYSENARGNESLLIKMKDATTVNTFELDILPNLPLFPNPTSSNIHIPNTNLDKRNITIYNDRGEMVIRYILTTESIFDITTLHNGMYYVISEINGHKSLAKVVKMH